LKLRYLPFSSFSTSSCRTNSRGWYKVQQQSAGSLLGMLDGCWPACAFRAPASSLAAAFVFTLCSTPMLFTEDLRARPGCFPVLPEICLCTCYLKYCINELRALAARGRRAPSRPSREGLGLGGRGATSDPPRPTPLERKGGNQLQGTWNPSRRIPS